MPGRAPTGHATDLTSVSALEFDDAGKLYALQHAETARALGRVRLVATVARVPLGVTRTTHPFKVPVVLPCAPVAVPA